MRILSVILGGVALYVLVFTGMQSLKTDSTTELTAAVSTISPGAFALNVPLGECDGAIPEIALTWTSSLNAGSYVVERADDETWRQISPTWLKNEEFIDMHISTTAPSYTYRVGAMSFSAHERVYSNSEVVAVPLCGSSTQSFQSPQAIGATDPPKKGISRQVTDFISHVVKSVESFVSPSTTSTDSETMIPALTATSTDVSAMDTASQEAAAARPWQKKISSASKTQIPTTTQPVQAPAPCALGGVVLASGQGSVFYSAQSVVAPVTCVSISQSRTCTNGALSGTSAFQYASCSVTQPAPVAAPVPQTSVTAVSKKLWGAYVGADYSAYGLRSFEAQIGASVNMQAVFIGWGSGAGDFPIDLAAPLKAAGKTLVIFWEPTVDLDTISSGTSDAYMNSFAASIKSYGGPVILVPYHEMNGNWDVWDGPVGGNNASKFITAWKHTHDLFAATGVTNVKWGWAVNNESVPATASNAIEAYYPGDDYVDIVGVDGFNFNAPWQSFDQVFGGALNRISSYNKPIYIFSFASAAGSQKAAWITDALATQMNKYPLIQGWIWFNENKEKNWLIWSDQASLAAFQAAVK